MKVIYDDYGRGIDVEETKEEKDLFLLFIWDYITAYVKQEKIPLTNEMTPEIYEKIDRIIEISGERAYQDLMVWCQENKQISKKDFKFLSKGFGMDELCTIKD
jgi:hypothetical protein